MLFVLGFERNEDVMLCSGITNIGLRSILFKEVIGI